MTHSNLRRGFTFWEAVITLGVLSFLGVLLFPIGCGGGRENARRRSCQSNLKQIMLGVKQYVRDYDEKYPLVATSQTAFGWAGALQPYAKSTQIFQCPSETIGPNSAPEQIGYTDYWFNARMAGVPEKQLENPALMVLLGDGDSSNARYHLSTISENWRKDNKSPLYRHLDGANYAFADGHVKWFRADKWRSELDATNGYTLRLKPRN